MDHLWTPWRSTYIKEKKNEAGCIFCRAGQRQPDAASQATADRDNLVVYRGSLNFILLNRYPYTNGHVMVAPYQHVSRLNEASEEVSIEMMRLARKTELVLQGTYRPGGLNLGMNLGEAAGAGIEQHIHMHMLPRWAGDANFMTSVGDTRIIPEAMLDTFMKLQAAFANT
jgi:ATP adenylyltransferase